MSLNKAIKHKKENHIEVVKQYHVVIMDHVHIVEKGVYLSAAKIKEKIYKKVYGVYSVVVSTLLCESKGTSSISRYTPHKKKESLHGKT